MTLFEKNLSALKLSDSGLAEKVLGAAVPEDFAVAMDREGLPGLRVGTVTLHSRYNAAAEAETLARSLAPQGAAESGGGPKRMMIVGLGLCHHVRRIADRFPGARIVVVEPRVEMLRCAMENVDMTGLLKRAELVVEADPAGAAGHPALRSGSWRELRPSTGEGADDGGGCEGDVIVEHPPSLRLWGDFYDRFRRHLEQSELSASGGKLKILVAGPMYGGSLPIARYCVEAFTALGHEVIFADHSPFYEPFGAIDEMTPSKQHQNKLRAMYSTFLGDGIVARCIAEKPDLLFALAQAPLLPETLEKIRKLDIPTAYWFVEDYHQMTYWKEVAPLYDFFFTIQQGRFFEELEAAGVYHHHYLPLAADPNVHSPMDLEPEAREELSSDVSFVGAGYYNRTQFFLGLLDFDFKIWGTEWNLYTALGGLVQRGGARISTEECVKIFNACPINVNLHSSTYHRGVPPDGDFVNPRTFELAAAGAFQLADERAELPALFEPGREIITFRDIDDLRAKIRYYLDRPDERRVVAEAARARTLRDHTYTERMASMLDRVFSQDARLSRRAEFHDGVADLLAETEGSPELHAFLSRFQGRERLALTDVVREIHSHKGEEITETEGIFLLMGEVWTWAKEKQCVGL